jgi:4-hydroxy-3-polyprenylbenzoate decarboxylase
MSLSFPTLHAFAEHLEKAGELVRIRERVSPILEITEIADRVMKKEGPALLFESVEGSSMPLLINAYGSRRRMSWALGVDDFEEVAARIEGLLNMRPPDGMWEKIKMLPMLAELASYPPKSVRSGACQDVVLPKPSLASLPIMKCWPLDGGRYITLGAVFSKDLDTGERNAGLYRVQVLGDNSCAMHWQIHHGGARHWRRALELGRRIEAAVVLGGDPCMAYCASAPLPDPFDELLFAGFLRRSPVELVRCKTIDLEVPAESDIVIEGYIDPAEPLVKEGPFGDHRGFYSLEDDYPLFHVTAVTHRRDAVYPSTIVGVPPMEDKWLGHASVRLFLPAIRKILPEIVDMALPCEGVFHNLAIVSIRKQYPGHARKVMNALWGLGQMMLEKIIVVVDEDVNVENYAEVLWRASSSFDPARDLLLVEGPLDALDHAALRPNYGGKMGLDCTRKDPGDGFGRPWPPLIRMSDEVKKKVDAMWARLGISLK